MPGRAALGVGLVLGPIKTVIGLFEGHKKLNLLDCSTVIQN